jgi:glycosyltransferase involved in cell wall biosynthesis
MVMHRVPARFYTVHSLAERSFLPWFNRCAFKLGVQPVAIADEVAASITAYYGLREVPCIPNGIPVARYREPTCARTAWRAREGFDQAAQLLVSVGRLSPETNHALMLAAFARIAARRSATQLLLVGDGPLRGALEQQAETLGLSGRVHFLGSRADIPEVLAAADLFLLSSEFEAIRSASWRRWRREKQWSAPPSAASPNSSPMAHRGCWFLPAMRRLSPSRWGACSMMPTCGVPVVRRPRRMLNARSMCT